jgi:cytochrome c553
MKYALVIGLAAVGALASGCGNLERSRDTANPAVSSVTLAQQVCSNCHGLTGTATSPNFPNLAAQQETYLVAQLTAFKSHGRSDPAGFEYMWGLSRSLTEKQIQGLGAYFAAQAPQPQSVESEKARIDAGKAIFDGGVPQNGVPACATCHGAEGKGMATFPRLAGQHADYIVKQLVVFQRTDERPEGAVMKTVAHALSRQNIKDVAAYVQAMPGL